MQLYELQPIYDSRASFYGKALIIVEGDSKSLRSYSTIVARIFYRDCVKKVTVYGTYSPTTLRHIKEFLLQNGFLAESKKQIEDDYIN